MKLEELKLLLRDNGIVGAGGAGFPSYAKLDKKADTIILNCAECEPLLKLHRQVLEHYTFEVLSALDLIAKTLGVKNVFVGIKSSYKRTIAALEAQNDSFPNIQIARLPEIYPIGDEVVLTYEVTKRVVPAGTIPLEVGVVVFNVETVYNLSRALKGEAVTHKFVSIVGEVANPITVCAPVGMQIDRLVRLAGGTTVENPVFLVGGPMMGKIQSGFSPITKTTNAIIVLSEEHPLIRKKQAKTVIDMKRAMAACCQCSYCTDLCPRNLLGHPIEPHKFMLYATNSVTNDAQPYVNSLYCSGCGLCEMYSCGQGLSPRALLDACKGGLRAKGVKPEKQQDGGVSEARDKRRIPTRRLVARLGLAKYNKTAPIETKMLSDIAVKILLTQHIGAPSKAVVSVGDEVKRGQVVAVYDQKALGVNIHASIDGVISQVTDKYILIESEG